METPQHKNRPKSDFGSVSIFFQKLLEILQKLKKVEGFPNIFDRFPLYLHLICFPFFYWFPHFFGSLFGFKNKFKILSLLIGFLFFPIRFLIFWVRSRFSENILNSQYVGLFSLFFRSVSVLRRFHSTNCT